MEDGSREQPYYSVVVFHIWCTLLNLAADTDSYIFELDTAKPVFSRRQDNLFCSRSFELPFYAILTAADGFGGAVGREPIFVQEQFLTSILAHTSMKPI
jgi:hypothetical protein